MQAVKLRPEETLAGPVRSDWLLLWRLLLRGLPSKGDAGRQQRRIVRNRLIYTKTLLETQLLAVYYCKLSK